MTVLVVVEMTLTYGGVSAGFANIMRLSSGS